MATKDSLQKFLVGLGVISAVGVVAGILLTPKSSKATLNELKRKAVNTTETIKETASHAVREMCDDMKDAHGKMDNVEKDIKEGFHEITKGIHKTAENISNEND